MLFFLLFTLTAQLSDDAIINGGTPNPAYGFTWDKFIYLNQLENLTKYDFQGNILARFNQKGQGPGEISAGGPMFRQGEEIWLFDVGSGRILIFDRDLNYRREIKKSLLNINSGTSFCVLDDTVYKAKRSSEDAGIETFSLQGEKKLQTIPSAWLQTDFKLPNITALYFDRESFTIYERVQNREYFRAWLYNVDKKTPRPLELFNPGYELQGTIDTNKSYFSAMRVGTAHIVGIAKIGDRARCFLQAYKRLPNRGGFEWFHYWRVDVDLATGKTVDVAALNGRLIHFRGPTEHALIFTEDENVELMPLTD